MDWRLRTSLLCFLGIIILLWLYGCYSEPQLKPGRYLFFVDRTVTEDWCYSPKDNKPVYGWWQGYPNSIHKQCISLKAPWPFDGTIPHENKHMDRCIHGHDPRWVGH